MADNRVHELLTGLTLALKHNVAHKREQEDRTLWDASQAMESWDAEVIIYIRAGQGEHALRFITPNVQNRLGYSAEALTSAPSLWSSLIHPDDLTPAMIEMAALPKKKRLVRTYRFRHKDGAYRIIRDEMNYQEDCSGRPEILGSWVDITERTRVEKALRENRAGYRSLVENSPMGMISFDNHGEITEFNPAVVTVLGAQADVTKTTDLMSVLPLMETGIGEAVLHCLQTGVAASGEFQYKSKHDRLVVTRVHVMPIRNPEGVISGAHAFVQDISDQKRAEELIVSSERLKVLGQIAGGVGHNFSNLLQILSGNAHMAITNFDLGEHEAMRHCLNQILDGTKAATESVRILQQFARQKPRRVEQKDIFDLSIVVAEVVEMCKLWAKAEFARKRINIDYVTELAPGCYVEGIRDQLSWVVLNFLKNSVEALPAGGKIRVKTGIKNDLAVITVKDNGVGIRDEDIKNVGQAFWTSKENHAGMGLAFNCDIIRRHGGTMGFKRLRPSGAHFLVRLPLVKDPAAKRRALAKKEMQKGYRILLIDDEPPVVETIGRGLRLLGQEPLAAYSGTEGMKIIEKGGVDAVVCDLAMNGISGWEVGRALMMLFKDNPHEKPPFLVLTGARQLDEEDIPEDSGVARILQKPVKVPVLLAAVREELSKRAAACSAFWGHVEGVDLLEYMQLLLLNGQKAVLEVVSTQGMYGMLYVDKGDVRHAVCGELQGEEALYKCLTFQGGSFSSRPWQEPERITITKPGQFVLIEAARKRDEQKPMKREGVRD